MIGISSLAGLFLFNRAGGGEAPEVEGLFPARWCWRKGLEERGERESARGEREDDEEEEKNDWRCDGEKTGEFETATVQDIVANKNRKINSGFCSSSCCSNWEFRV